MAEKDADGEDRGGATLLDWIKGLGLPIASLLVSGAIFFIQTQQQAFERQLNNVENGYRFYFEYRTPLTKHSDADQEEALLKMISSAFPNVFCYVRADLYARVGAAEAQPDGEGFGEDDRTILLNMVQSMSAPERAPLTAGLAALPWSKPPQAQACPPLNERLTAVAAANPPSTTGPTPAAAAPAAAPETSETADAAGSAPAAPVADQAEEAKEVASASPGDKVLSKVRNAAMALDPRIYRVFFHIGTGGVRDERVAEPVRGDLAALNFRVMRGVERVASMPDDPEIRYFGPDEEPRARELQDYLNAKFKSQNLSFKLNAIGATVPNLPRTTLEVWIPDNAGTPPPLKPKINVSEALLKAAEAKTLKTPD